MSATGRISVRRVQEQPSSDDGVRVLVDRIWPRGVSRESAHLDRWERDVAPSTELRQWYGHVPERFPEFARRYRDELQAQDRAEALERLRADCGRGRLTLLTATRDWKHSQAAVLAEFLGGGTGHRSPSAK